jgi:hypothetical protein
VSSGNSSTSPQTAALEGEILQPTPTFGNPQSINSYALHDLFTTLPFFAFRASQNGERRSSIYHRMRHIAYA